MDIELPTAQEILPDLIRSGFVLVISLIIWVVVTRLVQRWMDRKERKGWSDLPKHEREERRQRYATLWSVVKFVLLVTILAIASLILLDIWGIPLGPFLAVGTVIGVGLGFGAQDLVRSVIAGFFIIVEDQYGLGDVVILDGVTGTVEKISLRTTVLRDLEGTVHHVPNGHINVASNLTSGESAIVIDVSVAYSEDVDRAIAVVADEALRTAADPNLADAFLEPPRVLGVNELGDWSVDVRVVFALDPQERWAVKREFLRRIKNRLDAEGIEIPYPYVTVVYPAEDTGQETRDQD